MTRLARGSHQPRRLQPERPGQNVSVTADCCGPRVVDSTTHAKYCTSVPPCRLGPVAVDTGMWSYGTVLKSDTHMTTFSRVRDRHREEFSEEQADVLAYVVAEAHDKLATRADFHELTATAKIVDSLKGRLPEADLDDLSRAGRTGRRAVAARRSVRQRRA